MNSARSRRTSRADWDIWAISVIRLGIRAHDVGRMTADILAETIRVYGFDGVQLVLGKALDTPVTESDLLGVRQAFDNPSIMMLGAYFNPVHPDAGVVREGIASFKRHLDWAGQLGADLVGSETGSLMGSPWGYVPGNHEDETLARVIDIFKDLVSHAETVQRKVAVEGAYAHVAYSPQRIRTMLDAIASEQLVVTVDLFNFLHVGNHHAHLSILDQCMDLFKDKIAIFHLKDYVLDQGMLRQVAPGQGMMDYPAIIARIKQETPDASLIFEGVTGADIATSLVYIKDLLGKEVIT